MQQFMSRIEAKLDLLLELREEVKKLKAVHLTTLISALTAENKWLQTQVRRKNFIIFGMDDNPEETQDDI